MQTALTRKGGHRIGATCDFSLRHYEEILRIGVDAGYTYFPLRHYASKPTSKKQLIAILRHDIDADPVRALALARVEKQNGIKSSFFVRVHAEYNPFSYKVYDILRQVVRMGHEMGLHYESLDFANVMHENAVDVFSREKSVLESIFHTKISGAAAHGDFTNINNLDFWDTRKPSELGLNYEAYERRLFRGFTYVTDSRAVWRVRSPRQSELVNGYCLCQYFKRMVPRLYILTHPQYWYQRAYHLE